MEILAIYLANSLTRETAYMYHKNRYSEKVPRYVPKQKRTTVYQFYRPPLVSSATDKQHICVFTQLKCLKTQLRFTGLRTKKQKKSSIRKSDYFLCVQPYFNSCQNTGCLDMCVVTIEHMCLFLELDSRFTIHTV